MGEPETMEKPLARIAAACDETGEQSVGRLTEALQLYRGSGHHH